VYGRAGHLDFAHQLIDRYEQTHSSNAVLYISLLAACRIHQNLPLALRVFERLNESHLSTNDDQRSAMLVLMANLYASLGDHQRAIELRQQLSREKVPKYTGVTWTEVNGIVYEFYAHDRRHSRSEEIYRQLNLLHEQLRPLGYQPNTSTSTKEENIESSLFAHSERLAIVWNLMATPAGTSIQLTKNLRMCLDCHEVSKLIARLTQRDIIVRDRLRIHHFSQDGRCSCDNHF
jgi:tetratricopeptide (TPR) repeat protein